MVVISLQFILGAKLVMNLLTHFEKESIIGGIFLSKFQYQFPKFIIILLLQLFTSILN
jgi:hypothetical protein